MARPLRLDYAGAVWHLTSRGNARGDIFYNDHDRLDFLELLAEVVRRFGWIVYTYMLLDNHFHLVIETPEATPLPRDAVAPRHLRQSLQPATRPGWSSLSA